jgi:hypothetical protein
MSNIEFYEDNSYKYKNTGDNSSKMAKWLIEKGIAKDNKSAQTVLLVTAIIAALLAIFIFAWSNRTPSVIEITPEDEALLLL